MTPLVAIVGRPNVGKSTLFNRLAGQDLAIVHDEPGVTRDRHYADAHVHGRDVTLIDTGGFDPTETDAIGRGIARHVEAAIEEADAILCVLDGTASPTPADREAVALLRRTKKPVLYVANKADNANKALLANDLYTLGVDELFPVSAAHGRGFAELEAALVARLPPISDPTEKPDPETPHVAILGRPNAGKSTLFNRFAGEERSLVDARPGTTVDPVDTVVEIGGKRSVLVDTAGVRRKSKVASAVETQSVMRAIRAVGRADVVVLLCDATGTVAEQDARLLGLVAGRGRAVVVGLSKADLLDAEQKKKAVEEARTSLHFAPWASVVMLSSRTGEGIAELERAILAASESYRKRVPTAALNRFFADVLEKHPPPTHGGKSPRLYYVTQAEIAPPVFVVMCNTPEAVKTSYRRFVTNQIRKTFSFESVPVIVHFRGKQKKDAP
ncbi:MAG TPA: ribosome biogenesis GTPase Der [Polyangiaceae bacterium]|nr:ribosome biogenesis GTPase Der [Polyangiaceae bacterium]